jgi:hypothetical protein
MLHRTPSTSSSHVYTALNQPHAVVFSKLQKTSSLHHVFPRPRSGSPSALRSYIVVADPATAFCTDRHPRRSVRLSSPSQPTLSSYNHARPCVVSAPRIFVHCLMPYSCMILHNVLQNHPSLMRQFLLYTHQSLQET